MTRAKPSFCQVPRTWNRAQVAARLGKGEDWFREKRVDLEEAGFPAYDELLKGWDGNAIEAWLDQRSGIAVTMTSNPWDKAVGNGAH